MCQLYVLSRKNRNCFSTFCSVGFRDITVLLVPESFQCLPEIKRESTVKKQYSSSTSLCCVLTVCTTVHQRNLHPDTETNQKRWFPKLALPKIEFETSFTYTFTTSTCVFKFYFYLVTANIIMIKSLNDFYKSQFMPLKFCNQLFR